MKKEDVVVNMKVETDDGRFGIVTSTVCDYAEDAVWVKLSGESYSCWWYSESLSPDQPSLANTKIDVQKYADTYGLTLEEAHREIQPWLFEQGCTWASGGNYVNYTSARWIEVGVVRGRPPTDITWSNEGYSAAKEITLLRNVPVSLSIAPPEPSVELDGKQYTKTQLLEALAKLEEK